MTDHLLDLGANPILGPGWWASGSVVVAPLPPSSRGLEIVLFTPEAHYRTASRGRPALRALRRLAELRTPQAVKAFASTYGPLVDFPEWLLNGPAHRRFRSWISGAELASRIGESTDFSIWCRQQGRPAAAEYVEGCASLLTEHPDRLPKDLGLLGEPVDFYYYAADRLIGFQRELRAVERRLSPSIETWWSARLRELRLMASAQVLDRQVYAAPSGESVEWFEGEDRFLDYLPKSRTRSRAGRPSEAGGPVLGFSVVPTTLLAQIALVAALDARAVHTEFRSCRECAEPFEVRDARMVFCSRTHKNTYYKRLKRRGRQEEDSTNG